MSSNVWSTKITAADGKPLTVWTPDTEFPSMEQSIQYTNPRTGEVESTVPDMAWVGGKSLPENAVIATW